MRLYLDDCRPMPDNFDTLAKTAEEAIELLKTGSVTHISFDHDLGTDKTGYDVARQIEEWAYKDLIKPFTWSIHSANPVGIENIQSAMLNADWFWAGNRR